MNQWKVMIPGGVCRVRLLVDLETINLEMKRPIVEDEGLHKYIS